LTLWHGDSKSVRIFRLQKKVIRIIGKASQYASRRNLFQEFNTLPVPSLYISEVVCYVKSNMEKIKCNEEVQDHYTCQNDLHVQFCKTTVLKILLQMWA
jgi:hypothetical protein